MTIETSKTITQLEPLEDITVSLTNFNGETWIHIREGKFGNFRRKISLPTKEVWYLSREMEIVLAGVRTTAFFRKEGLPIYLEKEEKPQGTVNVS